MEISVWSSGLEVREIDGKISKKRNETQRRKDAEIFCEFLCVFAALCFSSLTNMKRYLSLLFVLILIMSCRESPQNPPNLLKKLMLKHGGMVEGVAKHADKHEVQILYTQIDRDSLNRPIFTSHSFRLDSSQYFYPASTVKLPATILALEKLNRFNMRGLDKSTTMLTDSARPSQTSVYADTTAEKGLPSIGHYIKKILLVSDNDAFNRLYEFIGQGPFNERLWQMGYIGTRIIHRLEIFLSQEENSWTNPIRFVKGDAQVYEQPLTHNNAPIPIPSPILKGKGEIIGGELQSKPKDFATKNAFPLREQQELLKSVLFPDYVDAKQRFQLSEDDYQFLYRYLSKLPRESDFPKYPEEDYPDGYSKFFLLGDKRTRMPQNIRIFSKIGAAYGFLIDNAYVVDFENKVEFLLSAVIYVNENQIFNDDTYEYDFIGFPFMAELGRMVYAYELQRPRKYLPDLSRFNVD